VDGVSTPPAPQPDVKDWTWVLDRPCPECGFDAPPISSNDVAGQTRAAIATLRAEVLAPGSDRRPEPDVWSPLEYGCHVRDACIVYGARLASMRGTSDPQFVNWNQDETALAERYWEQDPALVADELAVEGERIAADFASVRDDEWDRPGRRSDGAVFTVDGLARYFLHDLVHHVHDVSRNRPDLPDAATSDS
jgi:hypothetical protein